VVLNLKKLGIDDLVHFDFMDPPAPETMMRALELLHYLGSIDDDGNLTDLGSQMAELPLYPELARMLLASRDYNCISVMLTITSLLTVPQIFLRPKDNATAADDAKLKFNHEEGDHLTMYRAFCLYKQKNSSAEWCSENFLNTRSLRSVNDVRNQLRKHMVKLSNTDIPEDTYNADLGKKRIANIKKAIITGFFSQVAHLEPQGFYYTVKEHQIVSIHPSSGLAGFKPEWLLYNDFVLTNKNYIRICLKISPRDLIEINPEYYDIDELPNGTIKRELIKTIRQMEEDRKFNKKGKLKEEEEDESGKEKKNGKSVK